MDPILSFIHNQNRLEKNLRRYHESKGEKIGGIYGYVRVPRHKRGNIKYSVETQINKIRACCNKYNLRLDNIYIEEETNLPLNRSPKLMELMSLPKYTGLILIASAHCITVKGNVYGHERILSTFGKAECNVILLDFNVDVSYIDNDPSTVHKYVQGTMLTSYIHQKISHGLYAE
jgi:hypothetical protein